MLSTTASIARRSAVSTLVGGNTGAWRSLSSCPITGTSSNSSASKDTSGVNNDDHPELFEVPSLPLFGTTIRQFSNAPEMVDGRNYKFWCEAREAFGDFYTLGMPGFGNGLHGTAHVITDPKEMAKVIRSEGKYPSGATTAQWVLIKAWKELGLPMIEGDQLGFFGQGTDWKRLRTFLQTDLLSPKAANGYIPGFIRAAELASKGAPAMREDLNTYLDNCAFDMFHKMMFGQLSEIADPNTPTDEEMLEFIDTAKTQLRLNNQMQQDVYEILMGRVFNIKTQKYNVVKDCIQKIDKIGIAKAKVFMEKRSKGKLDEFEKNSWFAHAIERQEGGDDVSEAEMINLSMGALGAAVDTTAAYMAWNLLQVAVHPEVQQRLREELLEATQDTNGQLTADVFPRSRTPYLHAVVRESHRLTSAAPINLFKRVSNDIEIHGRTLPKDTFFIFDGYSTGRDPSIFDDHDQFKPDRWLPDAVLSRKGTPAEIIDNVFFKEPFSQGARRCPGSRVASNETHILLAQLVLDWEISVPGVDSYEDVTYGLRGAVTPDLPVMEFVPRS